MELRHLQSAWDEFGRNNPFEEILVADQKGYKWQPEEFFRIGLEDIRGIMEYVGSLNFKVLRKKALDFGCGVGRATQALTNYFDEVYGVDIAPSMIELANKFNRYPDRCKYYLNQTDNLIVFPDNSFDFIFSTLTLQHMQPSYSKKYINEFLRILAPGGLLIFQQPSRRLRIKTLRRAISNLFLYCLSIFNYRLREKIIQRFRGKGLYIFYYLFCIPGQQIYSLRQRELVKFLKEKGARIIDMKEDRSSGECFISIRYCVTKT